MTYPFKTDHMIRQSRQGSTRSPGHMIPPLEASAETPAAETLMAENPATDTVKSDDSTETHYETLTEQELRLQRKEEKYAICIGMLSKEKESDTETDTNETTYSYFN